MEEKNIVLYGTKEGIKEILDEKINIKIHSICLESLLDCTIENYDYKNISLSEIKKINNSYVIIIDGEDIKEIENYFQENNIEYQMISEFRKNIKINNFNEKENIVDNNLDCLKLEEIKNICNKYFNNILNQINNSRGREDSIYKINNELQKFKNDYFYKIIESYIIDLIEIRESCKKSLSDLNEFEFDSEKIYKYASFTKDELDNFLIVHDVVEKNGSYFFNNIEIYPKFLDTEIYESKIFEIKNEEVIDKFEEINYKSLDDMLSQYQERIEKILNYNEKLLKIIQQQNDYIKQQQQYANGLLTNPIIIKVIQIIENYSKDLIDLKGFDNVDNLKNKYSEMLKTIIDSVTKILLSLDVKVKDIIDSTLDLKYHSVLKMIKIKEEEKEKDKLIERYITDCYIHGEKVIYKSKVYIYKL